MKAKSLAYLYLKFSLTGKYNEGTESGAGSSREDNGAHASSSDQKYGSNQQGEM